MAGVKAEDARKIIDTQLEALSEALAAGHSDRLRTFLTTMARFHRYSLGNTLLIMVQRPEATQVAGFHTWLKLGRCVKKGETGIAILAPIASKRKAEDDKPGGSKGADKALRGEQDGGDEKERALRFRVSYVYDLSQTEGEPLPSLARPEGDPAEYLGLLRGLVGDMEIELEYRDDLGGAEGFSAGGLIAIRRGLSPAQEFAVLVHELAHESLHRGAGRQGTTRRGRELEAESVAFAVAQAIGLEAAPASTDYIHLYGGSKEALAASLTKIREVSARILDALFQEDDADQQKAEPRPQD